MSWLLFPSYEISDTPRISPRQVFPGAESNQFISLFTRGRRAVCCRCHLPRSPKSTSRSAHVDSLRRFARHAHLNIEPFFPNSTVEVDQCCTNNADWQHQACDGETDEIPD